MNPLNRRDFIKASGGVAMTSFLAMPAIARSGIAHAGRAHAGYRALVCVFLAGGNDSFNMLVPRSSPEYRAYARARQELAIPQHDLLPLSGAAQDSRDYGLHPAMGAIQGLFDAGHAAFVANVGTLVETVTRESYFNGSARLPSRLFSHSGQLEFCDLRPRQSGLDTSRSWPKPVQRLPGSTNRGTVNQSSTAGAVAQFTPRGLTVCEIAGDGIARFARSDSASDANFSGRRDGRRERVASGRPGQASFIEDSHLGLVANGPGLATVFPSSRLGTQLRTVAGLIALRDQLQQRKQVFIILVNGFDTHDQQATVQPVLFGDLSAAVAAFYAATEELGVADRVTTFTQSEFGRTLTSNGAGTDHAWGGNQLVLGGAVNGGAIYGRYPVLEIGGDDDLGSGRLIPSTATDQLTATLARWFGVPAAELDRLAPHVGNFPRFDLGFMR